MGNKTTKTKNQTNTMAPSKILFIVGGALIAAGDYLTKASGEEPTASPTPEGGTGEPAKRRGRPPGGGAAAPAESGTGPTDAERFDTNRALIKPLIDGGQGEDVKKVIAKYSKTGLKDLPAASQADFEKDIAALSY